MTMDASAISDLARRCDEILDDLRGRQASAWYNLPKPRRWHRCRVVHEATMDDGVHVERCACGGIRLNHGRWMERNR